MDEKQSRPARCLVRSVVLLVPMRCRFSQASEPKRIPYETILGYPEPARGILATLWAKSIAALPHEIMLKRPGDVDPGARGLLKIAPNRVIERLKKCHAKLEAAATLLSGFDQTTLTDCPSPATK
ncbi:hypothetical protein [Roseovarius sp. D0-M9]|uniref:hypothetical protein n=1 Tax=Roseovarius sp. D0-M9 TaxID=3127117 RepID=UPI003010093B